MSKIKDFFASLQEKLAFYPDYSFKSNLEPAPIAESKTTSWSGANLGTSVAGITGVLLTLLLVFSAGKALQQAAKH